MRRKAYALGAIGVAATLALAGCGSGSGDGQSGDGGSDAVPLADINAHDRGDLEEGGTLRFGIGAMPTYYNTMHVNGNTVDVASTIGGFVNPSNWVYQEDGTIKENPNYVEKYEVKQEGDKQVVTLDLNKDAKWGDGTPITWEDYKATWESCNGVPPEDEDAEEKLCASTDGYDHWESVEAGEDEFQVIVTFVDAFPDWSASLSGVSAKAGVEDVDTFNNGWEAPNNDWTAGPYQFASVDEAQKVVTLERNPNWWGEPGLLDTITFREMDPAAMGTGFANSEIDVLDGIIDAQQYTTAASRADAEIRRAGGRQWRHFTFNAESGVLQDKELRATLVRGIDRVAITEADLAGIPDLVPAELVKNNHLFQPGQEGYQDNAGDYAYDKERAEKELDEQGWILEDGAEYRTKDGETLEFEYTMMPDISTSKTEGELLQAQMKEIGVNVKIQNVDAGAFFDEYVIPGNFASTTFAWQGTPYPLANILQIYGCENFGGSNFSRLCVPEIDELAAKIAVEADHDKRLEMGNEVDKIIWENTMVLPIYARMEMTAVPKNLANYGAFGLSTVQIENVGFVKGE